MDYDYHQDELQVSLWDHISDLRTTLIRIVLIIGSGFIFTLFFYQAIFKFLTSEFINLEIVPRGANLPFLILDPLEGIYLTCKVCFWISFALTSPFWGLAALKFILPGLNKKEKRLAIPFLIGSLFAFAIGGSIAYFFSLPLANAYLYAFNATLGQNAWSLANYIDYSLVFFLGHWIVFELGLILLFLVHQGMVSSSALRSKRRYMIVLAFIVGAFLTPPDVVTQFILAIPLIALYELAIFYGESNFIFLRK